MIDLKEFMMRAEKKGFLLRRQATHSDLTEDIGSGYVKQNFVIQAQQPGLWFEHRFHA